MKVKQRQHKFVVPGRGGRGCPPPPPTFWQNKNSFWEPRWAPDLMVTVPGLPLHYCMPDDVSAAKSSANMILVYDRTNAGGRRSPAVACWSSDHWVASSNPLRGKFRH